MSGTADDLTPRPQAIEIMKGPALVAVAVVVTTSAVSALVETANLASAPVLVTAALYLAVASVGMAWAERERARRPWLLSVMLWTQLALGLLEVWISASESILILMPTISAALLFRSSRTALLVVAFMCAMVALSAHHGGQPALVVAQRCVSFLAAGTFVFVFAGLVNRERLARLQLHDYAARIEELATANERNRIAREIHDSVGHCLTATHVQIEAARALVIKDAARALECLTQAQSLAREGLDEVRRSVQLLRSGPFEGRPFAAAVAGLVDECRAGGVEVVLAIDGTARPLSPAVEFTLYRAAQEALTNVRKHAQAAHADVRLRYDLDAVALDVTDDGVGALDVGHGFGLVGLRERLALTGGTLEVDTAAGAGFMLRVRVPT